MKTNRTAALIAALLVAGVAGAQEKLPPNSKLVAIEARPTSITLRTPFEYSQLLLTGKLETGEQLDVTRMVAVKPPSVVKVSPAGQVRPVADGSGAIEFSLAGQTVQVPVTVEGQQAKYQAGFVRDVMPAMSKIGCNAGTCHGAQAGKNGFKLSLRGYDPLFDHESLTDELAGRRFNRAAPDASLMLLKPAGAVPHAGGVLMQPGDPYYELLRNWIAGGAALDLKVPRVTGIEILPKYPVLPLPGMRQQMQIVATYADGSRRDVTAEAFVESSNTEVAKVDKNGLVTAERRGEAAMLARYEGNYTASTLIVMGDRSGFAWKDVPANNFIDELVHEKLKAVKVLPSELCGDGDFIRRVTLDLTGLPPEAAAVRAFLADTRPTRVKREELVDKLVGSPDYVEHWTNKWADLLQVNRKFLGEPGAAALRKWIREAVATNMPYDKFAFSILTASGSTLANPPAAYYKVLRDPASAMENTTQLFLAVRFNCNKCHDHPFERWTQDQYYHLAAFFAHVGRKEDPMYKGQKVGGTAVEGAQPLVEVIADTNSGEVKHERTGKVTPPKFPYEHGDVPAAEGRREKMARWVTSKENQYFAKSYVNRLWSYLLGVGLIEPVDDIRAGNPASNPKLLDRLTTEFVQSGFNVQHMVKLLCSSRAYQHDLATNKWNADDELNYSHALARRLPAEVLYDAIHRVTGSTSKLPGLPPGSRAAQLLDANVELPGGFLTLFGKPPRESACECERAGGMMLGPVLALVNGPVVGDALKDPNNRIAKLLATEKDDGKVVEEIFLAVLSRMPTSAEKSAGVKALAGHRDEYEKLLAEHNKRAAAVTAHEKQLPAKQEAWEKSVGNQAIVWNVLEPKELTSKVGAKLTKQPDNSILVSDKLTSPELYTVVVEPKAETITGIRLEALTDKSLPANGPGRAPNGNFVVHEFKVTVTGPEKDAKPKAVALATAQATFSQDQFAVGGLIDGNLATGWAIAPQMGQNQAAVFQLKQPLKLTEGMKLTFTLDQRFQDKQHNLGKFRLSVTTAKPPVVLTVLPEVVTAALAVPAEERTDAQKAVLRNHYLTLDREYAQLKQALAEFGHPGDPRSIGAQDLTWALLNSPAFLFNH